MPKSVLTILCLSLLFACTKQVEQDVKEKPMAGIIHEAESNPAPIEKIEEDEVQSVAIERTQEQLNLSQKPAKIIHLLVPLCDNENQGIVPVNSRLGDGQNLNTNLYWGAGYGVRTFFNKSTDWEKVSQKSVDDVVLERIVYKHTANNEILLIADAYAGNHMEECLKDYFKSLSGETDISYVTDNDDSRSHSLKPNLVIFNGHNGLMDMGIDLVKTQDSVQRDAVAIACASGGYFKSHIKAAGGNPLLLTTNLLAPEAYVVHDVIASWLQEKSGKEVKIAAGAAYHRYQKCGIKGATNLFETGW